MAEGSDQGSCQVLEFSEGSIDIAGTHTPASSGLDGIVIAEVDGPFTVKSPKKTNGLAPTWMNQITATTFRDEILEYVTTINIRQIREDLVRYHLRYMAMNLKNSREAIKKSDEPPPTGEELEEKLFSDYWTIVGSGKEPEPDLVDPGASAKDAYNKRSKIHSRVHTFADILKRAHEEFKMWPVFSRDNEGQLRLSFADIGRDPQVVFLENYKVNIFQGSANPGKILQSLPLAGGAEATLSVRSWRTSEEERTQGESIFDSHSQDTTDEFFRSVQEESSRRDTSTNEHSWSLETEAKASYKVFSASLKAKVGGKSNATSDRFSKNVAKATENHVTNVSTARQVTVNTSSRARTEQGYEETLELKIRNPNVGTPVTYHFLQYHQGYYVVLTLTDVKVAYGTPGTMQVYDIEEIGDLVKDHLEKNSADAAKTGIINAALKQYKKLGLVEERNKGKPSHRLVSKEVETEVEVGGKERTLRGAVVGYVEDYTVPTDGMTIVAQPGDTSVLDPFATAMQRYRQEREKAYADALTNGVEVAKDFKKAGKLEEAARMLETVINATGK